MFKYLYETICTSSKLCARTWQGLGEVITQPCEQEVVAWLLLVIGITDYQLCILNQSEGWILNQSECCILKQSAHCNQSEGCVLDFQCGCTSVLQRDSNVVKSKFNRIHQKYTVLLTPLLAFFGHGFIGGQRNSTTFECTMLRHVSTKWISLNGRTCQMSPVVSWSDIHVKYLLSCLHVCV